MTAGFALIGVSGLALSFIDLNVPVARVAWAGLIQGVGSGILWVPVTTAAFWSLPTRLLPDGAAIFHLLRNLGTSLYVALAFLAVVRTSQVSYAELVINVSPFNEMLRFKLVTGAWSIDSAGGLGALRSEISRQAQMIGFNNAFVFYSATCFAVIPLVLFWRRESTATRGGWIPRVIYGTVRASSRLADTSCHVLTVAKQTKGP